MHCAWPGTYLVEGEWVEHAYIGTGVEDLVEVGFSIHQFQLVESLFILKHTHTTGL